MWKPALLLVPAGPWWEPESEPMLGHGSEPALPELPVLPELPGAVVDGAVVDEPGSVVDEPGTVVDGPLVLVELGAVVVELGGVVVVVLPAAYAAAAPPAAMLLATATPARTCLRRRAMCWFTPLRGEMPPTLAGPPWTPLGLPADLLTSGSGSLDLGS